MRKGFFIFQLGIVCWCFVWLYIQINWQDVWKSLVEFSIVSVGVLGLVFVQRFTPWLLLASRLCQIFAQKISFIESFNATALCVGVNALLPARLGEVVKVFLLKSASPFSYVRVVSGCVVERMLDMTMLLFLSLCFATAHLHTVLMTCIGVVLLFAWIFCFLFIKNIEYLQNKFEFLNKPFWQKYGLAFQEALAHITSFGTWTRLCALTIGIWLLNFLHITLIVNVLVGLDLSFQELGLLTVAVFFSSALLLAPGGIGVMETAIIATLQFMQIPLQEAAVVAIFIRLFHLLPSVLVGVFGFLQSRAQYAAMMLFFREYKTNLASR